MYELRDYQKESVAQAIKYLTKPNPQPVILVLATGAGKSLVIADIVHKLNQKVLVLQPQQELVAQNYEKMMSYNPDFEVGIYCAGLKRKEVRQVTYGTIQSVYKHPELFEDFEYVIIDECHGVDPKNLEGRYAKFLEAIKCKRVLGLTATPYRLENRFGWKNGEKVYTGQLVMLNRIYPFFFKSIIYKLETGELIKRGYLSPILYRYIQLGGEEDLKINKGGNEYTEESLAEFWKHDDRIKKVAMCIEKIDQYCQRSLIFCSSIRQATRTREMLTEMGIRSEMVTGSTPAKEREILVEAYRRGDYKHMLNVGVFTTGFDVPELDCVVMARQTMSLALYYQMIGRGVRLDPKRPEKKLRVYDLVRVVEKLGRVETITIEREAGGFRDEVHSEVGLMSGVPLFEFAVTKK